MPTERKIAPVIAQVNAILAAADGALKYWLLVLALTGMRVGELQRLRQEDVDLVGGWIHIRSRPGAETKTRDSRKIPIHPRLRRALEALPAHGHQWYFVAAPGSRYPAGGHWVNPKQVNDRFALVLKRLGMPAGRESGFVVHSLRHFFESFTVNAGIPPRAIDGWLGHRSDRSMGAVYYHLSDGESQEFMAKVPFGIEADDTGSAAIAVSPNPA